MIWVITAHNIQVMCDYQHLRVGYQTVIKYKSGLKYIMNNNDV